MPHNTDKMKNAIRVNPLIDSVLLDTLYIFIMFGFFLESDKSRIFFVTNL